MVLNPLKEPLWDSDASVSKERNALRFVIISDLNALGETSLLLRANGFRVREFGSARAFLKEHDPNVPGCAILDVDLDGIDGLELQDLLSHGPYRRPVIFVTACDRVETIVKAMKAGAINYFVRPPDLQLVSINARTRCSDNWTSRQFTRIDGLYDSVRAAISIDAGERIASKKINSIKERYARLTPREREVLFHVVKGKINKQIAYDLGTTEQTIKVHRSRAMEKMGVRSVAELVHLSHDYSFAIDAGAQDNRRGKPRQRPIGRNQSVPVELSCALLSRGAA